MIEELEKRLENQEIGRGGTLPWSMKYLPVWKNLEYVRRARLGERNTAQPRAMILRIPEVLFWSFWIGHQVHDA
jgi:hypothetical protein